MLDSTNPLGINRLPKPAGELGGGTFPGLGGEMARVSPRELGAESRRLLAGDRPAVDGLDSVGAPLERGARGQPVNQLQTRLNELGFNSGAVDGKYGPITAGAVRAFQERNQLPPTGRADADTLARLRSPDAVRPDPNAAARTDLRTYRPGSPEQVALFRDAARQAGLPESWASSAGLRNLLAAESGGQVGRPNYTYGERARDPSRWGEVQNELRNGRITARSSASGLGQLLLSNVERYYPSGRAGIGNPQEEAIGMLRYIKDRYGSPDAAWQRYNTRHEGY